MKYLIVLVFCILVGSVVFGAVSGRRRRRELRELAMMHGFEFDEKGETVPRELVSLLPLFMSGSVRSYRNLLRRVSGQAQTLLFDYAYTTGSGRNSSTYNQTVLAFKAESFLPQFQLFPESFLHKFMKLFGYKDINFPESPQFSGMFILRGPDENSVRSLFTLDARTYMQGMAGWRVEGAGQWLALCVPGKRFAPNEYADHIERARALALALGLRGL